MIWRVPARVLGEQLLGDHERVVHVRAEHRLVPAHVGQLLGLQLAGVGGEADDVEAVALELRCGSGCSAPARPSWRPGSCRAAPSTSERSSIITVAVCVSELGAVDLEVVRAGGGPACRGPSRYMRVHDRLAEMSRWNGSPNSYVFVLVGAFAAACRCRGSACLPKVSLLELRVDLAERLLADLAGAARRQLPAVALLADVAGLFEDFEELLELVERLARPRRRGARRACRRRCRRCRRRTGCARAGVSSSSMDCIWSMRLMADWRSISSSPRKGYWLRRSRMG